MNPNYFPPSGQRNTPTPGAPVQGSIFPGLGEAFPFNHMPQQSLFAPPQSAMPAGPAPSIGPLATLEGAAAPAAAAESTGKSSLFSLDKLSDLKGFVDRIGGLDGILGTMTKAQKIFGTVSQMAPLMKVMMGSFGKKGSDKSKLISLEDDDDWKPSKKRRKRKKRRPAGGGYAKGGRTRPRPRKRSGSKKKRRPRVEE